MDFWTTGRLARDSYADEVRHRGQELLFCMVALYRRHASDTQFPERRPLTRIEVRAGSCVELAFAVLADSDNSLVDGCRVASCQTDLVGDALQRLRAAAFL